MATKCSAEEIAEKKRVALEKLRSKKATQSNTAATTTTTNALKSPSPGAISFLSSMKQSHLFYPSQTPRDAAHPYKRPPPTSNKQQHDQPPVSQTGMGGPLLGLSPQKPLAPVFGKAIGCHLYMESSSRFAVKTTGYHVKMVDIFKGIPSRAYENNTHIWSFALKDYDLLHQQLQTLQPDVTIGLIPRAVVRLCTGVVRECNRSVLASIESTLANKLMPFQQEGVCKAIAQHGRIMICDEMGLGKTFQALAIADFYRINWPLLICTTASTRETWATHVHDLLPSVPLHSTQMLTNNQQYVGDAKILITSYNLMEKTGNNIMERKFGVLIFDESHTLKNSKAKCTVVADRLAVQAKQVILLSGTPALSRPLELFAQIQMIDRKFMSFREFTARYCDGKQTNFGWDANGQSNLEELNVLLKHKFMIRRTKVDVLPELAEKKRETVVLDPALLWKNEETKESLNTYTKNWTASKGREKEEILLRFYAITADVKTRAVCAYLKTMIKENIKFIIFAHHRVMMDAISDCLNKLKVNFVRIDGSTKADLRADYVDLFQKKAVCRVALLSLKACNAGITLTAAEMIIFAELYWNPSTLAQAESRAHRIGQDKAVVCRYLMANKTADDLIWNMLNTKQNVLNRAGLFCENLRDAAQKTAPTTLNKIDRYFSPNKSTCSTQENTTPLSSPSDVTTTPKHMQSKTEAATLTDSQMAELANIDDIFNEDGINSTQEERAYFSKDLQNIDNFFEEDDDDAFKDLQF